MIVAKDPEGRICFEYGRIFDKPRQNDLIVDRQGNTWMVCGRTFKLTTTEPNIRMMEILVRFIERGPKIHLCSKRYAKGAVCGVQVPYAGWLCEDCFHDTEDK